MIVPTSLVNQPPIQRPQLPTTWTMIAAAMMHNEGRLIKPDAQNQASPPAK